MSPVVPREFNFLGFLCWIESDVAELWGVVKPTPCASYGVLKALGTLAVELK